MILKITRWVLLLSLALTFALALFFHLGARRSLDQDFTHTREVAALPAFSQETTDGLVRIKARDYEFRARIAGFGPAEDGSEKPAVILLHGFPVTSAMWTPLIGPLRDAGYRVLALDQRGYSPGARPRQVVEYKAARLSHDVMAIANAAGLKKFHLIGHDWGALVGWTTVMRRSKRILSWTGLSVAHPAAFGAALENDPDQQARSRYIMLFLTPWLPETLLSYNNFGRLREMAWRNMSQQQQQEYLKVFSEPGALTAALNWYRAMTMSQGSAAAAAMEINTPTLFIWGNRDSAVGRVAIDSQEQYMAGPYQAIELDAGHWLMVEQPRAVIEAVLAHLAANSS